MFGNNLVFWWCCAFLLVASSSKHERNFTNNNEKHDISTAQYKTDENSIKNYDDEEEIDISTIYKFNEADCNKDSNECLLPYAKCTLGTCFPACCHLDLLTDYECMNPEELISSEAFVDKQYSLQSENQEINSIAYGSTYDPCQKTKQLPLRYVNFYMDVLIANGTVYFPYEIKLKSTSSCLMDVNMNMIYTGCNITNFSINFPTTIVLRVLIYEFKSPESFVDNPYETILNHYRSICISLRNISILFLPTIFLVYSILPQLRNKHGFILRNYIGATIVAYIFEIANNILSVTIYGTYYINLTIVSVYYFGFLAAYFWLTVMTFDMWWTFRDISFLLQINVRNRQQERERKKKERKKLIMYSVYAWGISFILTIVCVIMDLLQLEFGTIIYWFGNTEINLNYCIPSTICSISSICLFISTALKIRRYENNPTHHLRNVDSRVYNENKKWFNLCQKWFIMMFIVRGISAFIGIVSWLFPYTSRSWYIFYSAYLTEELVQNIGIFIIFVCKKRIKKLLLMRFGSQNYNVSPTARQTEVVTVSNRNSLHDETSF